MQNQRWLTVFGCEENSNRCGRSSRREEVRLLKALLVWDLEYILRAVGNH